MPVRVELDPQELTAHPLQVGLSMQVDVDTHERGGERLPQLAHNAPAYSTDVFGSEQRVADERVKEIIAANEAGRTNVADDRDVERNASARIANSGSAKTVAAHGHL